MPLPNRDSLVTLQSQLKQQEKETVLALGMVQGQLQLVANMLIEEESKNGE